MGSKTVIFALLALMLLSVVNGLSYEQAINAHGPLLYFPLDDPPTATQARQIGTTDTSGFATQPVFVSDVGKERDGPFGYADVWEPNTAGNVNGYIELGLEWLPYLNPGTGVMTIHMWAKPESTTTNWRAPANARFGTGGQQAGWNIYHSINNDWQFWWGWNNGAGTGNWFVQTSPFQVVANTWYHLVATRASDGTCTWYINGAVASGPTVLSWSQNLGATAYIGALGTTTWLFQVLGCTKPCSEATANCDCSVLGASSPNAVHDCRILKYQCPSLASGVYWVTLGGAATQVYCDMDTDGGGWTMIWKQIGGTASGALPAHDSNAAIVAGTLTNSVTLPVPPNDNDLTGTNSAWHQRAFDYYGPRRNKEWIKNAWLWDGTKLESKKQLKFVFGKADFATVVTRVPSTSLCIQMRDQAKMYISAQSPVFGTDVTDRYIGATDRILGSSLSLGLASSFATDQCGQTACSGTVRAEGDGCNLITDETGSLRVGGVLSLNSIRHSISYQHSSADYNSDRCYWQCWSNSAVNVDYPYQSTYLYGARYSVGGTCTFPSVATYEPAVGTSVTAPSIIRLTFSESMQKRAGATGNILVYSDSLNAVAKTVDVTSASVSVSSNVVVINLGTALASSQYFRVTVPDSVFESTNGMAFSGFVDNTWNFITSGTTGPASSQYAPGDGQTRAQTVLTALAIDFNEVVTAGSGTAVVTRLNDGATTNVPIGSATVESTRLYIPFSGLGDRRAYYVTVPAGFVKNLAGNNYAGVTFTQWNFVSDLPNVVQNYDLNTGWSKGYAINIDWNAIDPPTGYYANGGSTGEANKLNVVGYENNINVGGSTSFWYSYGDYAPQVPGASYRVNLWVKTDTTGLNYVEAYTADNTEVGRVNAGVLSFTASDGWKLMEWTFTNPNPSESNSLSFRFVSHTDRIWLYYPSMVRTDVAQLFSLSSRTPVPASTVAPPTGVSLTFNERIQPAAWGGNVQLYDESTDTNQNRALATCNINLNVLTCPFTTLGGTVYHVLVPTNQIQSYSNESYAGVTSTTEWKFTTTGGVGPIPTTFNPPDGTETVDSVAYSSSGITVTFDENVFSTSTGAARITRLNDLSVVNVPFSSIGVSGKTITIPATLSATSAYSVELDAGMYRNLVSQTSFGVAYTTWNFVTQGTTKPSVSTYYPPIGLFRDAPTVLSLTFSERIQFKNPAAGSITVFSVSDNANHRTVAISSTAVSINNAIVSINLGSALNVGTRYQVSVPANAFRSYANQTTNAIPGTTWWFMTNLGEAPIIQSLTPADNAVGVTPNPSQLIVVFDEVPRRNTGNIIITHLNSGTPQTVAVGSTTEDAANKRILIPVTTTSTGAYSVTWSSDVFINWVNQGVSALGYTSWNFVTAGTTRPGVNTLFPGNGDTLGAPSALRITYSERIQRKEPVGNVVIYSDSDAAVAHTIPISNTGVSISNEVVTISIGSTLNAGTQYSVTVPANAFYSFANQSNTAITSGSWVFDTTGGQPPKILTFSPADNSVGVTQSLNTLTVTFDEEC